MLIRSLSNLLKPFTILHRFPLYLAIFMIMVFIIAAVCIVGLSMDNAQKTIVSMLDQKSLSVMRLIEEGVGIEKDLLDMNHLNKLLSNATMSHDIKFIGVVNAQGQVVAHSDVNLVGSIFPMSSVFGAQRTLKHRDCAFQVWEVTNIESEGLIVMDRTYSLSEENVFSKAVGAPYTILMGLDAKQFATVRKCNKEQGLILGVSIFFAGILSLIVLHLFVYLYEICEKERILKILIEKFVKLSDAFIIFDANGNIVQVNDAARRLLNVVHREGSAHVDIGAKSIKEVFPEPLRVVIEKLFKDKVLEEKEVMLSRACGGGTDYVAVRGESVNLYGENNLGYVLFLKDVTCVKSFVLENFHREKLFAIGNLVAGVAHELRNPLSSIKGYASYLGERLPEGSMEREAARVMTQEVNRLNRAISDLIGLSLPEEVRLEKTDVRRIAQDTLRLIAQDAKERHISLFFEADSCLPFACIDSDKVRQVLLNLCLNALESMPYGGSLILRVQFDSKNQKLSLVVKDTGTGIDESILPHIFDPYFTTKANGTGFGLTIVHKVMEAHNGTVEVVSDLNRGTAFCLMFPFC